LVGVDNREAVGRQVPRVKRGVEALLENLVTGRDTGKEAVMQAMLERARMKRPSLRPVVAHRRGRAQEAA